MFASLFWAMQSPAHSAQCCVATDGKTPLKAEIIASGLSSPWGMAFLPGGSILVTERTGSLRLVTNGQVSKPIKGLPQIREIGQGGLLDVALDPDFADNRLIYFSYAERSSTDRTYGTTVGRAKLDVDALALSNLQIIFRSNKKSPGGRHFGSRLRFASDKTLFVTLGERGSQMRAQDPFDHAGSVIRINRDGSVPSDNPFADGKKALAEIWSIGHRNPQGAAIHPKTGELWTLSHGAAGGDEVNIAQAGRNYGWPLISYGSNYSGRSFAKGSNASGLEQPVYYWDPSIAPSGLAFYAPAKPQIPDWSGSLLAGALREQHLSRLILDGDKVIGEERYLVGEFGRIRDVRTGPDGAVWLLTDSKDGSLIRLTQKR
ncbi:MAG: PQQ-dependent sugar dehydrogenase [Cohaesibacter sp.]|nr:PQQ-dependent sugar dehydrogenase [Cohaesibacter sp.]